MPIEPIKYGLLLPAVIALVCGLSLWLRSMTPPVGRLLAAAGVGLGWLVATFTLGLVPFLPESAQAWHWLPALVVAAIVAGRMPEAWPVRVICAALLAVATAYALVPDWEDLAPRRIQIQTLLGAAVFATALLDRPMRTTGGRASTILLALTAGAAAAVLELGGTGIFAQMAGALAAALLGISFAAHRPGVGAGFMPIVAVLVPGLLATGRFHTYSQVPLASYLLVALAPFAFALPIKAGWRRVLIQAAVVLVAIGIAVGLAYHAEPIDWQSLTGDGASQLGSPGEAP
jgi:hypothetical protein